MSINSPAKLHRLQRHLMRQRGTGVSTISATFGFYFGSNTTSSAATTTATTPTSTAVPSIAEAPTKKRKRLDFEEHAQNWQRPAATGADDSFVGQVKTKRVALKKSEINNASAPCMIQEGDVDLPKAASTGRPRRQAAADAAVKVADGFLEEAAPIDKKRRDEASNDAPKKGRRVRQETDDVRHATADARQPDIAVDPTTQTVRAPKRTKPKAQTRKQRTLIDRSESPRQADADVVHADNGGLAAQEGSLPDVETTTTAGASIERDACRSLPSKESNRTIERSPLKETSINVARPTKRRKTPAMDESKGSNGDKDPNTSMKAVGSVRHDRAKHFKDPIHKEDGSSEPAVSQTLSGHAKLADEDIGCLFESDKTKRPPKPTRDLTADARVKRKPRAKIADIDLDDLLSNIASFAKTTTRIDDGGTGRNAKFISRKR